MNGEKTKFYKYDSSTSANVTIPLGIAKALNWNHKDEINLSIKSFEGKLGLFLFHVGTKTKEQYQNEFLTSYLDLERELTNLFEKVTERRKEELYGDFKVLIGLFLTFDDIEEKIKNYGQEIVKFRNRLVQEPKFDPSLEEYGEMMEKLKKFRKFIVKNYKNKKKEDLQEMISKKSNTDLVYDFLKVNKGFKYKVSDIFHITKDPFQEKNKSLIGMIAYAADLFSVGFACEALLKGKKIISEIIDEIPHYFIPE